MTFITLVLLAFVLYWLMEESDGKDKEEGDKD